jgi:hypothetical protein
MANFMFADRVDTWVIRVSIGLPILILACFLLWHLVGYVSRKLGGKRVAVRQSPEPPKPVATPVQADPEQMERECAVLAETLAEKYLKLAELWTQQGQPQRATAVLRKIVQACPESPHALAARERLEQLDHQPEA